MSRENLDKLFERGILALVLAILVFAPLALGAVNAWAFVVVQGLAMGVMALWGLRLWLVPKTRLLWPPLCWVVLAFAVYAVIRYLTADIEYVARQEMIRVLVYAVLFLAVVNNLYRQESVHSIGFTMIFLATGIAGYAMFQFFTHSSHVWWFISPYSGRASGTYISPNDLAGFLEMLLPLALAFLVAGRLHPLMRVFVGYAALVIGAGLAVTFSRGGWVAAALGVFAVLLTLASRRQHRMAALLILALITGAGGFAGQYYLKSNYDIVHKEPTVINGRVDLNTRWDMWMAAADMWRDHFWFGVGPAHYNWRFREYRDEHVQNQPGWAHNDYLNLLAEWGATGGMIVLAGMTLFAAGFSQTWKHVQRGESSAGGKGMSNRFAFFTGACGGLLALAAHSFIDFNLHIPANAILGVTLLALVGTNLRFATDRYWAAPPPALKAAMTAVAAAGILYLGWQGWRRDREAHWLRLADSPRLMLLERAALLRNAFAVEPKNGQTAYDIGEALRMQSFAGDQDYAAQATNAMRWFRKAIALDHYDGYAFLRIGMCLDWLGEQDQSGLFYRQAELLDPNGYYMVANIGWHYLQIGDDAAACQWFKRSLRLQTADNVIASTYLDLTRKKMMRIAAGKVSAIFAQ
ncbi:MAG: O-antigen ligase family protein [Verrucomicrobia bacterium]|nr:O-antigen ligase family protein [Verrucomicrobiota bacterium]MDE3099124.1 O-antigen ligase family protein [Verrucomicrobiota bacterium]